MLLCTLCGTWVDPFAASSLWFMHMKWHTCCYAVHSSWYMSPSDSHNHQLAAKRLLEHPGLHKQERKKLAECQDMGFLYDINTNKSWLPWNKQTPSGCGGARLQGDRPLLVGFISGWLGTLLMSIKPHILKALRYTTHASLSRTAPWSGSPENGARSWANCLALSVGPEQDTLPMGNNSTPKLPVWKEMPW